MGSRKLDRTELARKDLIDKVRTVVRLEHRIAMRHELNEIEHRLLDEFDRRVAEGRPHEINYDEVRSIVEGSS